MPCHQRFLSLLLLVVLASLFSLTIQAEESDFHVLAPVKKLADGYLTELKNSKNADFAGWERRTFRLAVDALLRQQHCKDATSLARQIVSGETNRSFVDWMRLERAARCAKRWSQAVPAAYWGFQAAENDEQRGRALLLLGAALEAHWRFGTAEALVAYQKARAYIDDVRAEEAVERLQRALDEARGLRVERYTVDKDSAFPAVCLKFSNAVLETTEQNYADYIRVQPKITPVFRKPADDQICVEGVAFGTDYMVRIMPGLRGAEGVKTRQTETLVASVGDRPPRLWFANSRYVLPPGGGVPLQGINVSKSKLKLYRVDSRNLMNEAIRQGFRTDLSTYQIAQLRSQLGEQLWQGEAELDSHPNQEMVTNLPLGSLAQPAAGLYVLTATPVLQNKAKIPSSAPAAQWLVVSDIGLTTYRGEDGLTIVSHRLTTAKALPDVRLELYGRNNRLLARSSTDPFGRAHIEAGKLEGKDGREPVLLMAFGEDGDFNFFDITSAPFDLSDRGVKGRLSPGPLDAFLYTERGVYRPGAQVQLAVLLRDDQGKAVDGLPLTLRLIRPDEQPAAEQVAHPLGSGGYHLELPISSTARTGRWKIQAYLDREAEPVGETAFLVEAILPPRIELAAVEVPEAPLRPNDQGQFAVQASYLFGAPAAELVASAELRIEPDPNPFPELPGFRFGPVDEMDDSVTVPLEKTRTGAQGEARFDFQLESMPGVVRPLRARLRAEVTDVDGRSIALAHWVPVRHRPLLIGVKAPGGGGAVKEDTEAVFEIVALQPDGSVRAHPGLVYQLVEEQVTYQWYRERGRWRYKKQVRDRSIQEGTVAVTNTAAARVGLPLQYGSYRLEVRDPDSDVLTSVRLQAGWDSGGPDSETPDRLSIRTDQATYRPGDRAKLQLTTPFFGVADLVIATDRVLSVHTIDLSKQKRMVEIPVDPAWGAGAYVLVTAYRPDGGETGQGPRRAVGVVWLGLDPQLRRLELDIGTPERVRPRGRLDLDIGVRGQQSKEPVYLTLAAVDEGVLRLTDYRTPDPLIHYFGQRQLDVGVRDLYGRLIHGHAGSPGRIRSGGGSSGRQGAPESHVQIVSLFSGVVKLDAEGRGRVPLDLPDFNGRLRLMAVAWTGERVGSADTEVTVRDPVVVTPSGPRFLADGDQSHVTVLLHNLEGPEGQYRLSWKASGALGLIAGNDALNLRLKREQRERLRIPLRAIASGEGRLRLTLRSPSGEVLTREVKMGVRAPFLPQTRRLFDMLQPDTEVTLGADLVRGLRPETVSGLLTVSATPDLDVPGLLKQLDLYPYGCLEQVVSRAFPLLYLERLATRWGYESDTPVAERLKTAISHILDKQLDNGAFALWYPGGQEENWLSVYALDFLQRARAAGMEVPDFAWERGLGWLRRQVVYPDVSNPQTIAVQAYALYLLARNGEAPVETARYLLDEGKDALPSGIAAAQLGAALALMGDTARSTRAFRQADQLMRSDKLRDYGSRLRDLAALVQLQFETDVSRNQLAELLDELIEEAATAEWLSTQELAWLVRASDVMAGTPAPLLLDVQGKSLPVRDTPLVLEPTKDLLTEGLALGNRGAQPVWLRASVTGSPIEVPKPLRAGFEIKRLMYQMNGQRIESAAPGQGDLVVVVLEGKVGTQEMKHQALIIDPLPAGLEIESARLTNARKLSELEWLGDLTDLLYSEGLDDRYIAALDLDRTQRRFRVAYLARAVTPGEYQVSPVEIEDMYKPRYRGRGEAGSLRVAPAR